MHIGLNKIMTRLIIGILDRIQSYLFAKPDEIRLMMSPLLFIEAFHRTDVRRVFCEFSSSFDLRVRGNGATLFNYVHKINIVSEFP